MKGAAANTGAMSDGAAPDAMGSAGMATRTPAAPAASAFVRLGLLARIETVMGLPMIKREVGFS